jgi:pimeloyl-ACP methyl ester carboxylesterase
MPKSLAADKNLIPVFLALALAAFLYAPGAFAIQAAAEVKYEPFTFRTGDGRKLPAELGRMKVPENRTRADSKTIDLAFMRLKSRAKNPGPPLVLLAGGPGGSGIAEAGIFFEVFEPLLEFVDIIAFEQRSTGQSRPYLACQVKGFEANSLASRENMVRYAVEFFRPCAESWRAKGVDFSAYNTRESADDVEDLRKALGVEKINLWGFSYGTQLAFAVLRRHPQSINRAVLAGVEGPNDTRKLPRKIQKHLEDINQLVKADPEWSKLIPDFLALMKSVHEQLDKQPATVEVMNRQTKQKNKISVGKFALQVMVGIDVGDTKDIVRFPALYYSISKGDYTLLAAATQRLQDRITAPAPWAMIFPVDCASGATKERDRRIKREAAKSLLGEAINFPWPEICEVWGSPDVGDDFRKPVKSKVPVLFISGSLDGRTPISNSQEQRKGFPNSTLLIVDGAGHEDVFHPLATRQAIADFINGRPLSIKRITFPPPKFLPPSTLEQGGRKTNYPG